MFQFMVTGDFRILRTCYGKAELLPQTEKSSYMDSRHHVRSHDLCLGIHLWNDSNLHECLPVGLFVSASLRFSLVRV